MASHTNFSKVMALYILIFFTALIEICFVLFSEGNSPLFALALLLTGFCLCLPILGIVLYRQRQKETENNEKSREMAQYFNSALDLLAIADTNGYFRKLNPEWEKTLGYSVSELLGRKFLDFVHPEDMESTLKAIASLSNQDAILNFTNRYRHKDGSYRWIEWRSHPSQNSIYAVARDITEQKKIQNELRQSEEKFRTFFENIMEGVALHEMIYDESGKAVNYRIIGINPAYEQHVQLTREIVVGKLGTEVYGTPSPPYLEEFSKVAQTSIPYRFETYFSPMKKYFIISVICPKPGQFATVFEDITERKQREEDLRQKNEELARFTYTVSHDLKSPLVTIKAFTGYLKEDIKNQDQEALTNDLGFIQNAADKMGKLLDELLEFSRVGRKDNPKIEISLSTIAHAATDLVAGKIRENKVKVVITETPVVLFGDPQRLQQLYQNLIDNAVKFIGSQINPIIEIGVEENNNNLYLFVRDNGMGIDPRYHHKLFNLFEKLDKNTEGTGIGLALIKRIIDTHKGTIFLKSEGSGKGTTFYFTLEKTKFGTIKEEEK